MRLNKLEIHGFKSFADKTELVFDKQFSVIVGPNGSGKSNISDAIRWVLGEQSAKSLRGSKMEDVIFTGTENSKPMNYSKVSITFDNAKGMLPVDYKEVVVSRKVFRDGDSEYTINKNNCRLKDIRELFMDTGVGKEGYSIISQGRIDEILSSRPEERRLIFDEASGVAKLKYNKEESAKKLKKTLENLTRIKDIINQLKDRTNYLEKESQKAKEGLKYISELETHQLSYYKKYLRDSEGEMKSIKHKFEELSDSKDILTKDLESINESINPLKTYIESLESELNNKNSVYEEITNKITYLDAQLIVLKEKIGLKTRELNKAEQEISSEKMSIEKINKTIGNEEIKISELDSKIISTEELYNEKQLQLEDVDNRIIEIKKNQQEIVEKIGKFNQDLSEMLLARNTNIGLSKNFILDLEKLNNELNELEINKKDIEENLLNRDISLKELVKERDLRLKQFEELKTKYSGLEKKISDLVFKETKITAQIQQQKSNLEIIKNIHLNYEGFNKSVQRLIKAGRTNPEVNRRIIGTLAELITVKDEYQKAIEFALGQSLQNIVTNTGEDAKYLISFLKSNRLGRVTFLPIDRFEKKSRSLHGLDAKDYLIVASDAIECSDKIRNIIEYHLSRTLIVRNMDEALKISSINKNNRIVTLEGDIVNTWGSMIGGSVYKGTGTSLINRKSEMEALAKSIRDSEEDHISTKQEIIKMTEELDHLKTKLSELNNALKMCETDIDRLNSDINEKSIKFNLCSDRIEDINLEIKNKKERQSNLSKVSEDEIKDLELTIKKLDTENESIDNDKRKLYDAKMNLDVELLQFNNEKELLKRDRLISENTIEDSKVNLEYTLKSIERNEKFIIDCDSEIKTLEKNLTDNSHTISLSKTELETIDTEIENLKAELKEEKIKYDEIVENRLSITSEISKLDLDITRIQSQLNSLNERIQNRKESLIEEYSFSEEELEFRLDSLVEVKTNQNMIKNLKNKIRDIGHFSYDSIEEFQIVSNEYEFYKTQKDDLLSSKADIEEIIQKLDLKIIDTFNESFSDINERFNNIFSILFKGGRARLVLNTGDVLNSGVDIEVEPPGKKLQNLSLLSGGERALTAVALLFAIFETRPAPFCILDEVDAALDESNIARYVNYLKSFKGIQFIIITHRKLTMEIADILYGVTMEQEGISKMLTLSLENA